MTIDPEHLGEAGRDPRFTGRNGTVADALDLLREGYTPDEIEALLSQHQQDYAAAWGKYLSDPSDAELARRWHFEPTPDIQTPSGRDFYARQLGKLLGLQEDATAPSWCFRYGLWQLAAHGDRGTGDKAQCTIIHFGSALKTQLGGAEQYVGVPGITEESNPSESLRMALKEVLNICPYSCQILVRTSDSLLPCPMPRHRLPVSKGSQ